MHLEVPSTEKDAECKWEGWRVERESGGERIVSVYLAAQCLEIVLWPFSSTFRGGFFTPLILICCCTVLLLAVGLHRREG